MQRVLVTGAAGYIGSELTRQLLQRNYKVTGLDSLLFGGESLLGMLNDESYTFVKGDIRDSDALRRALAGCDCVVHFAAIVGDPACAKDPETAWEVNLDAAKALFEACQGETSVQRFVFASTCSNYGRMNGVEMVDETSELNPVSVYAQTKVDFERYLLQEPPGSRPARTVLRFATVYGVSARLRFDLTVNDFVRQVVLGNELVVFGEQFWRPYCHVRDLARACIDVVEAKREDVDGEVFGVGDRGENYQKKMIVNEIAKVVPNMRVRYVERLEDPRDYRVDFSKIHDRLGFEITRRVPDGIKEIKRVLEEGMLVEPSAQKFINT